MMLLNGDRYVPTRDGARGRAGPLFLIKVLK